MNPFNIDWHSLLEPCQPGIKPVGPYIPLGEFLLTNGFEFWEEQHSSTCVKLTCTSPLGGEIVTRYEKQVIGEDSHIYLTKIVILYPINPYGIVFRRKYPLNPATVRWALKIT